MASDAIRAAARRLTVAIRQWQASSGGTDKMLAATVDLEAELALDHPQVPDAGLREVAAVDPPVPVKPKFHVHDWVYRAGLPDTVHCIKAIRTNARTYQLGDLREWCVESELFLAFPAAEIGPRDEAK